MTQSIIKLYSLEASENDTEELQTISDSVETPQEIITSPARSIRRRAATRARQWTNILLVPEDFENGLSLYYY